MLTTPSSQNTKNKVLIADIVLFVLLLNLLPFDEPITKGLSILIFVAVLWLTEVIHISITALLVPILAVSLNVFNTTVAFGSFAHPIIFLFLGGFALASALHKQGLDRSEEHTSELQSRPHLVCRLLLEKKK